MAKVDEGNTAQVTVMLGSTLNMGQYESLKVQVGLTYPCKASKATVDKAFEGVFNTVNKQMRKRVKELTGRG